MFNTYSESLGNTFNYSIRIFRTRRMWRFKKIGLIEPKKPRVCSLEEYDATYVYPKKVLLLLGLRLMRKDSPFFKIFWDVVYWFEFVNLFVAIILNFLMIRELIENGDFDEATKIFRMIPCVGYLILAMLKTYKMVYKRSVFENLVEELRSMWPLGEIREEEYQTVTKALNEINFLVKAYYYCNVWLSVSIIVPPYLEVARRIFGQDLPRILPYKYWIPYDGTVPGWYEVTLTIQCWQTLLTVWCMLVGDLLFCVFLSHITLQFDLLCIRIKRIFYVTLDQQLIPEYPLGEYNQRLQQPEKEYNYNINANDRNNKHQKEISEIVMRHRALIRLAGDVEDMFSFCLLINFFYSSIIICFCGFCSVVVEKWNEFMYKTFLLSALSQTWLLCWYGQKLFDSSQSVANALYNCGWYTASMGIKKCILIMIHRCQYSVHITTYGFSIICLASFTSIVKTAWSYFTLLRNTYTV